MNQATRFALLGRARHGDAVPLAAQAQRKSPLADAPAIRKRFELRATRLEIGAGFGLDDQPGLLSHAVIVNVRLAFHITDWLAIAGLRRLRASPTSRPASRAASSDSLDPHGQPNVPREPTQDEAQAARCRRSTSILGAQLEFDAVHGQVLAVRQAVRALRLLRVRRRRPASASSRRRRRSRLRSAARPTRPRRTPTRATTAA